MPALSAYDYAIIRVVPRVERGECVNAGVILFCRTRRFLGARVELKRPLLQLLAPELDLDEVQQALDAIVHVCAGGRAGGPLGELPQTERFHWLVAPRSAIIQTSPVHSGLCHDPAEMLERLCKQVLG